MAPSIALFSLRSGFDISVVCSVALESSLIEPFLMILALKDMIPTKQSEPVMPKPVPQKKPSLLDWLLDRLFRRGR